MSQIVPIQILRGVAALTVAFGHAQHDAKVQSVKLGGDFERVFTLPWGAGVDLFFVISGFIMVYSSERLFARPGAAGHFLGRRLVRIAPLYWLFTGLYLALLIRAAATEGKTLPALPDILASFAFWPTDTFGDGIPRPILTLGWTLNYEMFFYGVFALFIGLARGRAVLGVAALLGGLVLLGTLVPAGPQGPLGAAAFFWTRPILLEFACGMGLALLLRAGVRLSAPARGALVVAAIAALAWDAMGSGHQALDWTTPNDALRVLGWGVPAALLVAAAALGAPWRPAGPGPRLAAHLGDASYALYLSHPFVIFGFRKTWMAAGLHERLGFWPMLAASLVLACLVALLVHRLVEKPLTTWLQARTTPRPGAAMSPPNAI
jgi:exopolysaccharide production protein ExoZ